MKSQIIMLQNPSNISVCLSEMSMLRQRYCYSSVRMIENYACTDLITSILGIKVQCVGLKLTFCRTENCKPNLCSLVKVFFA